MFGWLFQKKYPYSRDEILNDGVMLSLAFGKHWLQPVQGRLRKRYPRLTEVELNEFNEICTGVRDYGHKLMCAFAEKNNANLSEATYSEKLRSEYSWITDKTLRALYGQGLYYVHKDFGPLKEAK